MSVTMMLDESESKYLKELLESDLADTRVEFRRSMTPQVRYELRKREEMIQHLIEELEASSNCDSAASTLAAQTSLGKNQSNPVASGEHP